MVPVGSGGFHVLHTPHVRCKTNTNILLFTPLAQDANDSFVPCFAFVLCIMTSAVLFYMDHKPKNLSTKRKHWKFWIETLNCLEHTVDVFIITQSFIAKEIVMQSSSVTYSKQSNIVLATVAVAL